LSTSLEILWNWWQAWEWVSLYRRRC